MFMIIWAGVFTGKLMRSSAVVLTLVLMASALVIGCTSEGLKNDSMLRGFNVLQHKNVAWDDPRARRSVKKLAAMGSNAVVFIPFFEQDAVDSLEIRRSDAVTESQLKAAIAYAHEFDLKVIIKPQMLIPGSWAGAIKHHDPHSWQAWFDSYSKQIIACAKFSARHGVDAFVVGTELSQASGHVDWPGLIARVREVLPESVLLTYAAHNIAGLKAFPHWKILDTVALTMYPSLGSSGEKEDMQRYIEQAVEKLRQAAAEIERPLWVMEIGMPSAAGASVKPWEWQNLKGAEVDLTLQRDALDLWLKALDKPWVNGVYVWAWYSDVRAGGVHDTDFTPQNKPAEYIIRRYWKS